MEKADVIVIGGGAAGIFCAIHAAEKGKHVVVLEKSNQLLSKVKVSGGGRCNVTHDNTNPDWISRQYPRGRRWMKAALHRFSARDVMHWFESRGVPLKTEADGRVFPKSDKSSSVINCLLYEAEKLGVEIRKKWDVSSMVNEGAQWVVSGRLQDKICANRVVVAVGGQPKLSGYQWLENLGVEVVPPVPSLFTFRIDSTALQSLSGISAPEAKVLVRMGTGKVETTGPLLITHWGLSGPAILKASAFGARIMNAADYRFQCRVNWLNSSEEDVYERLDQWKMNRSHVLLKEQPFNTVPRRLWTYFMEKTGCLAKTTWQELSKKEVRKLAQVLTADTYPVNGKSTFKEEFVTAGGVSLNQLNTVTLEHKNLKGLYFVGEIMNVDGVTGGFNFQHAWCSGYVAGKECA